MTAKRTATKSKITQAFIRQSVDVGPFMGQVSPVSYWIGTVLTTPEQVVGAIELARQQSLDGMGVSLEQWTGLSLEQLSQACSYEATLQLAVELLEAAQATQRRRGL